MNWRGREVDPVALWSDYVDFPAHMEPTGFSSLVHCPNPDHDTTKRHFQVNLDLPLVHCFAGCGISGSYEHAIAMIEGCSEAQAKKVILKHARLSVGPNSRRKGQVHRKVERVAEESLGYELFIPQVGVDYLRDRGVTGSSISRFQIGWCMETRRIVLPARDLNGTLRFLIKRTVGRDFPKYLYTEGAVKERLLYGACTLDMERVKSGSLVLVEGSIDAVKLQQHGIDAVAILGSKLSKEQLQVVQKIHPRRVVLMFDPDASGVRATLEAAKMINTPLFVALYPYKGTDPAQMSREEAIETVRRAVPYGRFFSRLPRKFRERQNEKNKEVGFGKDTSQAHRFRRGAQLGA